MYTLGKDNGRADALSRKSNYIANKDVINKVIFKQ